MKAPRLLRSPFMWILAVFLIVILWMNLFSASSRYQLVPTSQIINVIEGDEPLREVGTHLVPVKLHTNVEFPVTVEIVSDATD